MLFPSTLLYYMVLLLGSLISVSSSTWMGAWVGLEINLMSFIPLMYSGRYASPEAVLKYFLVQAFSSLMFILAVVIFSIDFMFINNYVLADHMMLVALGIKLGAAPFHFWVPGVSSGISWFTTFLMLTWQKFAPLFMLMYFVKLSNVLIGLVVLSSVVGAVGGISQTSLRKMFAYSSINHLSWMVIASFVKPSLMLVYFLIYSVTSLLLIMSLIYFNVHYLIQLLKLKSCKSIYLLMMNLFSYGGLPPMLGFMPKWVLIDLMIDMNLIMLSIIMVMFSLLSLFYYMRLGYSSYIQSSDLDIVLSVPDMKLHIIWATLVFNLLGIIITPLFMNVM